MWGWSCRVTLSLLFVLDAASCGHEEPPPSLPISDHEFPRKTNNPVPYLGVGVWKQPPEDIDVGFVPQKTYSQVRKTSRVVHLPQSDALESASDSEEVYNAPRLREVVKHTQIREVYEEEGFEDNAYDHGGYKKAAEHHTGYKKGDDEPNSTRLRRQRGKIRLDSQGQHTEARGLKTPDKEALGDEYEGKGDGAIEEKEVGVSEEDIGRKRLKLNRGRGSYKFHKGDDGGSEDDGNRNYSYGRMVHKMEIKNGVDKMDDKGRVIVEKGKVKGDGKTRGGSFVVHKYRQGNKNQARKRESPMDEENTEEDSVDETLPGNDEVDPRKPYEGQGSLEDSFGKEHSATDRPDKGEYLEAKDEERRLKEEEAMRDEEIEQHYLETTADILKDYEKPDPGIDHRKYPYYATTKNKHSPLRYALNAAEIPRKTAGGLEFYDSKDFYHCEEVKGPGKVTPEKQKDGEWAGAPRKGIFPRLSGLGDKIDCFKNKYWGNEPLDSPFFKEGESVKVENKKRDTQDDDKDKSQRFEDSSGFYADIVGNIRSIEKGNFPATNFDSGGPLVHRPKDEYPKYEMPYVRPTRTNEKYREGDDDDHDEEDDHDNDEDKEERREEPEKPTYPQYVNSAPVYESVYVPAKSRPLRPLYANYALYPKFKTKRNHHHIILNILPPIKYSKPREKSPPPNSYQVQDYKEPKQIPSSAYPLYPPLGNEIQKHRKVPPNYYVKHPSQVAEYQASNVMLTPHPIKLSKHTQNKKHSRSPSPNNTNKYSTPIKTNEEYVNIFGLLPPPANLHFKYQTLTLLQPINTTVKFRRPKTVQQIADASNVVRKFPMVDNMAQETYDVVAKVSNLTQLQLKKVDVKLRVKRSRLYSEIKPVREDVDEDDEPKVIRKRKRFRSEEPWRNEEASVTKEIIRSFPSRNEEQEDDSPVTSSPGLGYDVHEEVDDFVSPFEERDFDFPDNVGYPGEPNTNIRKVKQYSTHNHRPMKDHVEEITSQQPETLNTDEHRGRKRKLKRKRKKPKQKQKHFWSNVESYEINEKEPDVIKYVEWNENDDSTVSPPVEEQVQPVDKVSNIQVQTVEKVDGEDDDDPRKRRRQPAKRVRIQRPKAKPQEKESGEVKEDGDYAAKRGVRKHENEKDEAPSEVQSTHSSLKDSINGWISNHKGLEILSLNLDEEKASPKKNDRKQYRVKVNQTHDTHDEEASSSEQTEVTIDYPKVLRKNQDLMKPPKKIETVSRKSEQEGSESKNSREKTSDEEHHSTDNRRGEPKYKEVRPKKGDDDVKNNTHMTIHEEIRLTPSNAPPPIVLTPEEINAKLALLFKDQKYGSRYNAKEPQESVNTLRKLRPDDPEPTPKTEALIQEDITTTTSPETTTTATTPKIRVRPLFSIRSRNQNSNNDTKDVNSEPKQESLRSRTQFSQRSRGRSRESGTTTERSENVEKESQRTRVESNQRTKVRDIYQESVKEVSRSRSRRPIVKQITEVTTQTSKVARSRARYRFTTTTKATPASNVDSQGTGTFEGRRISRNGRNKTTTELPESVNKDQKKGGNSFVGEDKDVEVVTVPPTHTTAKTPKRIFLFNRPKPTTTVKPYVTTKNATALERPKTPLDILSKFESTNAPATVRHKGFSKIQNGDIKKVESKTPSVVTTKTVSNLNQNRVTKVNDNSRGSGGTQNDKSKPRQLNNFETRKVTKEEIYTTSYIPEGEEDEEAGEEGDENDDEEGDDEYADESENDGVAYESFENPYFKFEQNKEQSKKVERFEIPSTGWGNDNSGSNRNNVKGRLQKKGFLRPQESLARQTLATDRTLTYIVDPYTRIGTWVEGRT